MEERETDVKTRWMALEGDAGKIMTCFDAEPFVRETGNSFYSQRSAQD